MSVMTILFSRLVVLLCCLSLFSCTTRTSVYPVAASAGADVSWHSQIKTGDRLVVRLKDRKKRVVLKVKEITSSEIKGEVGEVVNMADVRSIESKRYSWLKNIGLGVLVVFISMLVLGGGGPYLGDCGGRDCNFGAPSPSHGPL
jgi:hypothetical protein